MFEGMLTILLLCGDMKVSCISMIHLSASPGTRVINNCPAAAVLSVVQYQPGPGEVRPAQDGHHNFPCCLVSPVYQSTPGQYLHSLSPSLRHSR